MNSRNRAWRCRPIMAWLLIWMGVASFCLTCRGQQVAPNNVVKVTVQVLDPASKEGKLLPRVKQFSAGSPVFHMAVPAKDSTLQVLANSVVVLHADRKASFAIEHPDVLARTVGEYVFASDVQGIFKANKAGNASVTITYAALPDCQNAPYCSSNWSGYLMLDSFETFTGVSGQWTVPTVVSTTHGASSTWVGIGGWKSSPSLIQAGTEQDFAPEWNPLSGSTYYAWFEMLPAIQQRISYPVSPGDVMQVSITPSPGTAAPTAGQTGQWLIKVVDATKNWTFTTTQSYASDLSSAEWIEEATTQQSILGTSTEMANYGQVEFNFNDQAATGNQALSPVFFVPGQQVWLNQNGINGVFSTPSNPSGDGKGFYVTYTVGLPNQVFPPGPWIQTVSPLPPAQVNQPYSQTLVVNEATTPVWSLQNGTSLPAGLALNASSGTISGTPTMTGTYGFGIHVTDTSNGSATANVGYSLAVNDSPMGNLDISCLGISPPVTGAVLNFAVDGKASQQCANAVISLEPGLHTVTSSVTGSTQVFKYFYAGACGPSGQVTVNQGVAAQCSIHAQTLSSYENACPGGLHCCEPGVNGCTKCIPTKMACP